MLLAVCSPHARRYDPTQTIYLARQTADPYHSRNAYDAYSKPPLSNRHVKKPYNVTDMLNT